MIMATLWPARQPRCGASHRFEDGQLCLVYGPLGVVQRVGGTFLLVIGGPQPGGVPRPQHRDPQLAVETGAASVHDLLRRTNPDPMTATLTYADGRTLPVKHLAQTRQTSPGTGHEGVESDGVTGNRMPNHCSAP